MISSWIRKFVPALTRAVAVCSGALMLLASVASAETPPADGAAQAVKDAWLDGRLETTYALNPHLNPFDITTEVENGVVTLRGTLENDIDRDLALEIANGIDGVREVKSSLTVDSSAKPQVKAKLDSEGRTFLQRVNDAVTTARVKSNLVANGNTKGLAIDVDTEHDVVTLKGSVASRKEKMLAEMIARNTDGITSVRNELEITEST